MSDRTEKAATVKATEAENTEPEKTQYVEFLGVHREHGTEFYAPGVVGHTVTRQHLKETHGVDTPKDLEWTKAAAGRRKGRMLLATEGISTEVLEILEADPMFRLVEL